MNVRDAPLVAHQLLLSTELAATGTFHESRAISIGADCCEQEARAARRWKQAAAAQTEPERYDNGL